LYEDRGYPLARAKETAHASRSAHPRGG
jgi:hypothetical protein